jgi:hypothetical protein
VPDNDPEIVNEAVAEEQEEVRPSLRLHLTDATAQNVALYISQKMAKEADDETLEYDFHIVQSEMSVDPQYAERNTWFRFDTRKDDAVSAVKKAMFDTDCNIVELDFIDAYLQKVCRAIERQYAAAIEDTLRRVMFKGKPYPLKLLRCTNLEIIDFSNVRPEENYNLIVHKNVPRSVLEEGDVGGSVSAELFKINIETGKGFNAIIREKKAAGDPAYKYVTCAETKKMLWEAQLDMFVDYAADRKKTSSVRAEEPADLDE